MVQAVHRRIAVSLAYIPLAFSNSLELYRLPELPNTRLTSSIHSCTLKFRVIKPTATHMVQIRSAHRAKMTNEKKNTPGCTYYIRPTSLIVQLWTWTFL